MSIIIEGMEMPKNCSSCPFCFGANNICPWTREYATCKGRHKDCPLTELPPHGDLIDRDALMLVIQDYIEEYGWYVDENGFHSNHWCAMKEAEMAINDAPVIVPREEKT